MKGCVYHQTKMTLETWGDEESWETIVIRKAFYQENCGQICIYQNTILPKYNSTVVVQGKNLIKK